MKELTLVLDSTLFAQLGLQPDASAADIGAKLKALSVKAQKVEELTTKVTTLETELQKAKDDLQAEQTATVTKEITAMLDDAEGKQMITAAEKALLAKDYAGKATELKAVLKERKPFNSITAQLNSGVQAAQGELEMLSSKTFDELWKSNKLARLKEIAPAVFEQKKAEHFKK